MNRFELDDNPFFTDPAPEDWRGLFSAILGARRLESILTRMDLKEKKYFSMRDLAKIVIGSYDVLREDVVEVMKGERSHSVGDELMLALSLYKMPEELPAELFDRLYLALSNPFREQVTFKESESEVEREIEKLVHFVFSCLKYDPYWFAKKRKEVFEQSLQLDRILFYERLAGFYAACEDLQVGTYLPAEIKNGVRHYYRVTATLISGAGQVGIILVPATRAMELKTIRVTRGSPSPPGGLDFISHAITDMEPEIGRIGYESGLPYQPYLDEVVGKVDIEVGYSIGGTIAQWRTSENPHDLSSLWLYKSPGVPKNIWAKFNENAVKRANPLDLFIFQAKGDIVGYAGDMLLGYQAPAGVRVALYELSVPSIIPHRYSFIDPAKIAIAEIESNAIDEYLNKKSKIFIESQRKKWGKTVVVPVLNFYKKMMNKHFSSRLQMVKGLKLEMMSSQNLDWDIQHIVF